MTKALGQIPRDEATKETDDNGAVGKWLAMEKKDPGEDNPKSHKKPLVPVSKEPMT